MQFSPSSVSEIKDVHSSPSWSSYHGENTNENRDFGSSAEYHVLELSAAICIFLLWLLWASNKEKGDRYGSRSQYLLGACALGLTAMWSQRIEFLSTSLQDHVNHISDWYMDSLEDRPVITKSLTTGIIQLLSDYFAQVVEGLRIQQHPEGEQGRQSNCRDVILLKGYDFRRGLALLADGVILSGPLLHYAFEFMEHCFPTENDEGSSSPSIEVALHVLANDYLVDTTYLFISFFFVAIAEGHIRNIWTLFRKDFLATVQASWGLSIMLMPVEYLCFSFLPVKLRVLSMNFIDILWSAVVSFVAHRSRRKKEAT